MPKMKTNRTAYKKLKTRASGTVKRAQQNTSHNTAKKSPKRIRQLRNIKGLDKANEPQYEKLLPYRAKQR